MAFVQVIKFPFLNSQNSKVREVIKLPEVKLMPNENAESLLRRFRKSVAKAGTMSVIRQKRWHVSKSELRRIEKKKAARRAQRKRQPTD